MNISSEQLTDILKHGLMITAFVLIIMLIIEYINVWSRGRFNETLKKRGWLQVLTATSLGLIPGCLGTFTVVSLYTHNVLSFGSLIAALISTSGDEAFFMFTMIPSVALKLNIILFIVSLAVGLSIDTFFKKRFNKFDTHYQIHEKEIESMPLSFIKIKSNIQAISFTRALLLSGIILFILGLLCGQLDDSHLHAAGDAHGDECILHDGSSFNWFNATWVNITFLLTSVIALVLILAVPEHFLEAHLWEHIIKKHFLKVLLWTVGALALTAIVINFLDIQTWIQNNLWFILLVAVLVGIIPESGPHMIFISLFMAGSIPFSILLANSMVQDGHGALPLLAESKKSFFLAKFINVTLSFFVGSLGLIVGF